MGLRGREEREREGKEGLRGEKRGGKREREGEGRGIGLLGKGRGGSREEKGGKEKKKEKAGVMWRGRGMRLRGEGDR